MKLNKEMMKQLAEEMLKASTGQKVEPEMLIIKLENKDAVMFRFLIAACDDGTEDSVAESIFRAGMQEISNGLLKATIKKMKGGDNNEKPNV